MHQKFDQLIDDYFPDLKDEKEEKIERCPKTGDYVFKKINRDKEDYVRIYESDGPPIFTDLVENESKIGTVHITNPLPKIERKNELKKDYLEWLKMERLMKPNERREEYELMQNKYLETIKLSNEIKQDIKLARVIKSHYPRGIVGVDSVYNENTVLYKDKYEEIKNKEKYKNKISQERREALQKQNNRNGDILAFDPTSKT
ncbi:uncharacterized protein LOC113221570 isoform X1 [Piliocolobus tephrosceles]|uniref:uncharacterized protein LOC113221570 isoform X1 n=1 Tax=Piliocolobus tephrosceles TaxID=591936 RepID=UPI000E6B3C73|nr:uncharacterized protein LOC113221570 isoform X1 [Piliocolobus tephrosceles]